MKQLDINFASKPFRNLRLYYSVFGICILVLLVVTVLNLWVYFSSGSELSQTRNQIASIKEKMQDMKKDRKRYNGKLQKMNLSRLNKKTTFVNDLFRKRYFSWTELLNRLEDKIPAPVMLKTISPNLEEGQIRLSLECVSRNSSAVVDFIKNLEDSRYYRKVFPNFEKEEIGETFGTGVGFNLDMIYEATFKQKEEDVQKKSYIRTPI